MKRIKINQETTAYCFDDLPDYDTFVYRIEKPRRTYIIDTFCGAATMAAVREDMISGKPCIVMTTHHHWDHIWGNSAFENALFVAHALCEKRIKATWDEAYKENGQYSRGEVKQILPQLVFEDRIRFADDGIQMYYCPGHTNDSCVIYDEAWDTLYAGDNLEMPLVSVESVDLERYIVSLQGILEAAPKRICAGHTLEITLEEVEKTMDYLKALKAGQKMTFSDALAAAIHRLNQSFIEAEKTTS